MNPFGPSPFLFSCPRGFLFNRAENRLEEHLDERLGAQAVKFRPRGADDHALHGHHHGRPGTRQARRRD